MSCNRADTVRVDVVLPAYRKASVIVEAVRTVASTLHAAGFVFRLIVVIDGDVDGTEDVLHAAGLEHLTIVVRDKNYGKGNALKFGIERSSAPIVAIFDADLDVSPEFITRSISWMRQDPALAGVIGSKRHPQSQVSYPLTRRILSRAYHFVSKIVIGLDVSDSQTGAKVFDGPILREASRLVSIDGFAFDLGLLALLSKKGHLFKEGPIEIRFAKFGSSISASAALAALSDLWTVRRSISARSLSEQVRQNQQN